MRRWVRPRFPTVIWFTWSHSRKHSTDHQKDDIPPVGRPQQTFQPFLPKRFPWTSLVLYASVLSIIGVLFLSQPGTKGTVLPVTGHVGVPTKRSWLALTLKRWHATPATFLNWLDQGLPLVKLSSQHRQTFHAHVRSLIMTALTDISGVELNSLQKILEIEIPGLSRVPLTRAVKVSTPPPSRPHSGQNAVGSTLPGDGGRVWAELGTRPLVGIYQTHSREAFWPVLPKHSSAAYSMDWPKTVVQVGWWLAQDLHALGISVIQSRVDNMSQGLLASYSESYNTAKDLLKWYPSVHILLDIHRSDKPLNETTAVVRGVKTARILLVVGSNKLLPNPYSQQNLHLAVRIARGLRKISPAIVQGNGIDQVPYRYNQQLAPGDLLVEIGGSYNTLGEERNAAKILAQVLIQVIKRQK